MAGAARVVAGVVAGVVLAALVTACEPFTGADFTVNTAAPGSDANPGDGVCEVTVGLGDCSFRAAVTEANWFPETVDRVTIQPGIDPLPDPYFSIDAGLIIEGNGATLHEMIYHDGGLLDLHDLTITGTTVDNYCGGGIHSDGGALRLFGVRVIGTHNAVPRNFQGSAAVCMASESPLWIEDSVIADNTVGANSDGATAAVLAYGDVSIFGSTVSGNQVASTPGASGGGILLAKQAQLVVGQSTITGNTSGTAGATTAIGAPGSHGLVALSTVVGTAGGPAVSVGAGVSVVGSIVASAGAVCAAGGAPSSSGSNVTTDSSCGFGASGDVVADPLLGPLADNGGPSPTRVPAAGSPAVDGIPTATPTWCDGTVDEDQRGSPRPVGAACDIGAVER